VWAVVVVLLGGNALAGAAQSTYAFQYLGQLTAPVAEVAARFGGHGIERVVIVGRDRALWSFALTADGLGPMVPELFGDPQLNVEVVEPGAIAPGSLVDPHTLVLDADRQFARINPP
jgi:hypothetical protein